MNYHILTAEEAQVMNSGTEVPRSEEAGEGLKPKKANERLVGKNWLKK